jgi:hypothetical protein
MVLFQKACEEIWDENARCEIVTIFFLEKENIGFYKMNGNFFVYSSIGFIAPLGDVEFYDFSEEFVKILKEIIDLQDEISKKK